MKKILVLFKTHLDVGFTDFSGNVVEKYNSNYIPQAIRVAKELAQRGCREGFVWTTGSWLIDQYRCQASEAAIAEIDEAIQNHWIRWHGLPTTMHSEAADETLFRYGLSISKNLDEAFGVTTIAGKYTDVPGHTRAIVPLLADAGIEFLHIGVNAASTAPDVPLYFRWQSPEGKEITVMYNKGYYGEFSVLPGTDTGVYFAHTNDNCGPSSADEILEIYAELHKQYPEAEIVAGDLNDLAMEIRGIRKYLPVVTQELGDAWIHGTGTDPQKMNQYRALLRLAEAATEEERQLLYRALILIPEHTWGMDEKTWVADCENFSREKFNAVRGNENYRNMEKSWAEQRAYITAAVNSLPEGETKAKALRLLKECSAKKPDFGAMKRIDSNCANLGAWEIAWDDTGAVVSLKKDGRIYADAVHPMAKFRYESFSAEEVCAFQDRYIKPYMRQVDWAVHDFGKVGLEKDNPPHCDAEATLDGVYMDGSALVMRLSVSGDAVEKFGCPAQMALRVEENGDALAFDFAWFDKPASRIPEAIWLGFCPTKPLTAIRKLGSDIHPLEVVSLGNRELHCTEGKLSFEDIFLELIDSGLIAVGKPSVYAFHNQLPDTENGIWANLFNNQWGTNFPMWNEGDARFRFVLR